MSKLGAAAVALAVAAVVVSGIVGVQTQTALGELACEFVAVGMPLSTRSYPSAERAATAYAESLSAIEGHRFPGTLGAIEVMDSDTMAGDVSENRRVFAVRGHGRTVALVVITGGEGGSWVVSGDFVC